jgi:hypothetical protein
MANGAHVHIVSHIGQVGHVEMDDWTGGKLGFALPDGIGPD